MTEEENKKFIEIIQDALLDMQLEGRLKIEEISTDSEEGMNIRIKPIINSNEEAEEFMARMRACGYTAEKIDNDMR
jgi:hypothetical protein